METISLGALLRRAWQLYKQHLWLLVLLTALQFLLSSGERIGLAVHIISGLALILLTFVTTRISLFIVDGKPVRWNQRELWPTPKQYLKFLLLVLATLVLIVGGTILLVIPGLYIIVRLYFGTYSFVDSSSGNITGALKRSWGLIKGKLFWKVALWILLSAILNIAGILLLWVGLLVALPITWITTALLFREIEKRAASQEANIVPQPPELETATPSEL